MQFSPSVRARGTRWHIVGIRAYEACRIVTLSSVAPPYVERRLIEPFDTIDQIHRPATPEIVSAERWRGACREALAAHTPPGSLRQGRSALIDLMPHQLEPAMAILAGRGTRVLLADEVGLGKTIQAGLVVSELRARSLIDRILVIAPAGLRDQWRRELADRFAIDAMAVDARVLRQRAAALPIGVNPWSTFDVAIVSHDFVKRAEVLPAVASCRWDAIVVDEAHGAAGDSDRRTALDALAARASYVLLLTATPHSGDPATFASLCALGSIDDEPLLVFRRRRSDVRSACRRRVHTLRVQPGSAERRMHTALSNYADAVVAERGPGACLALSVLHKRAFSSPWSLAQSVARRLITQTTTETEGDGEQLPLPLGDPDGDRTPGDEPPEWPADLTLSDSARDRRLLMALRDASRSAIGSERKLIVLRRLLRRAQQPAIVFTEYRDTLFYLQRALAGLPIAILHGGMSGDERTAALAAFEAGSRTVLLATDAAGEGLNLQRSCRLVVNLELPWNPMRLEQRIGRVDRIGQTKTTHAVHLVGDGTGEVRILERLHARVARAQADIGAPDPVSGRPSAGAYVGTDAATAMAAPYGSGGGGGDDEKRIARLVVTGAWLDEAAACSTAGGNPALGVGLAAPDLRREALHEVERLRLARLFHSARTASPAATCPPRPSRGPIVVRASHTTLRRAIGSKALLVWRLSYEDHHGTAVESHLVAVTVDGIPCQRTRAEMRRTIRGISDEACAAIESMSRDWRETAMQTVRAVADTRLARERAILARAAARAPGQFQPGLFDMRAARVQRTTAQQVGEIEELIRDRIAWVERQADVSCTPPALILAVLP